ncbi:MAG: beta-ketoacyl-[acyl-carrier-protein] synthase family protein [Candidatus Eremiobacteraeota bacterium]|nr:beta-ketoacyl-[acyl-carrier-protein] synthase family protein [Candidatus Eremiobacteraeota bacterium]
MHDRQRHRVAVTGIGLITPLGSGVQTFWKRLRSGEIAVDSLTRFDASAYPSRMAAQIDDFKPEDYLSSKRLRWTDRFSQFAVGAAKMALEDGKFSVNGNGNQMSVFVGSALGGLAYAEEQASTFNASGIDAVHPLLAISVFGGASTSNIAIEFGLHGQNVANANSCAAGAVAIGQAYRAISQGESRAALAGGVEAPLAPLLYGAFTVINAMSRRNGDPQSASRPFDRGRDGFVMSEGAGMLLMERLDDARARGARIYGEVCGFGLTNDAYHMSAPRPDSKHVARAMQEAIDDAGVSAQEIDAINAHGSSTPLGDRSEAQAYKIVFGDRAASIPVSATKGQHGHALGATGAWEAAISLLSMRDEVIPATVNFQAPDDDSVVKLENKNVAAKPQIVLSNSSGFGGINTALVFRR